MMKKLFFFFVLGLACPLVHAQGSHPLDRELEVCLQENPGTTAERHCYNDFAEKWDEKLNFYYKMLGGSNNIALRDAQRAWIAFRDQEFRLLEESFSQSGTIYEWLIAKNKMEVIRQRAMQLWQLWQVLEVDR